ncbi:HEAT repeat domain-containing protein [Pseudaquabacterium pictum]|uniref:PBS lyase n=1 Tax=Pseudaquabacterium pictum TaxID=2315236 RepID=A0A480AK66_9BURK|nr:HEAT repeat domain-containing protein [Rubrivivax pictus]GCL61994.1 PBS lyase [Rubrivivax pictus]
MGLRKTNSHDALREVVEREHPRDLAGLLGQLRSGDVEQRRWAARDLAAHPQAASALGEQLLTETDASVRESMLTSLTSQASEAAAGALLPLLRSEDAQLRNGAIEALAGMPQAAGPRIAGLLRDADVDVRIFTVNLLGELRHPQVLPWLLQVLARDPEVNVVAAAVEVLAEVGSPEHGDALRAARARFAGDDFIGFAVDMAVERIEAA